MPRVLDAARLGCRASFDAETAVPGLMVRSRNLAPTTIRGLVRDVSNIASRVYPTCARLMPISG